jgi:hypothetical protein
MHHNMANIFINSQKRKRKIVICTIRGQGVVKGKEVPEHYA